MDWDDTQLAEGPGRPYGLLMHPTMPPLAAALALSGVAAREGGAPVDGRRRSLGHVDDFGLIPRPNMRHRSDNPRCFEGSRCKSR